MVKIRSRLESPTGRVVHNLHGLSCCCMFGEGRAGRSGSFDRVDRGLYSASCLAAPRRLFDYARYMRCLSKRLPRCNYKAGLWEIFEDSDVQLKSIFLDMWPSVAILSSINA